MENKSPQNQYPNPTNKSSVAAQFAVTPTTNHHHSGSGMDGPQIDYKNLLNKPKIGGSNTDVQFNDNGVFGGSDSFTYSAANGIPTLRIGDALSTEGDISTPDQIGSNDGIELALQPGFAVDGNGGFLFISGGTTTGHGAAGKLQLLGGGGAGDGDGADLELYGGSSNNASAYQGHIVHGTGYDGSMTTYSPAAAATATLDLAVANEHRITMPAGNITIALKNVNAAQKFLVSITQDFGGSRTVTWFTTIKWAGGVAPTLTTTANKRDTFGFVRTGSSTYDGFIIGQNI